MGCNASKRKKSIPEHSQYSKSYRRPSAGNNGNNDLKTQKKTSEKRQKVDKSTKKHTVTRGEGEKSGEKSNSKQSNVDLENFVAKTARSSEEIFKTKHHRKGRRIVSMGPNIQAIAEEGDHSRNADKIVPEFNSTSVLGTVNSHRSHSNRQNDLDWSESPLDTYSTSSYYSKTTKSGSDYSTLLTPSNAYSKSGDSEVVLESTIITTRSEYELIVEERRGSIASQNSRSFTDTDPNKTMHIY